MEDEDDKSDKIINGEECRRLLLLLLALAALFLLAI
jgi:hypothetical protein